MLDSGAEDSLPVRVDLGEQAAQPVADAGGLAGQVVVEAHDHFQLGDCAGEYVVDAQSLKSSTNVSEISPGVGRRQEDQRTQAAPDPHSDPGR